MSLLDPLKPYLMAAFVVGGLALLGGIYAKGQIDARHALEKEALERSLRMLRADIERERRALKLDAEQAIRDQKDADLAAEAAKEIVDDVEDPHGVALGSRDADRLRAFARGQHKAKAPAPAK